MTIYLKKVKSPDVAGCKKFETACYFITHPILCEKYDCDEDTIYIKIEEPETDKKNGRQVLNEVVKELLNGLTTDGAHHKQYYLERAFRTLCQDEYVDGAKKYFQWEEGIE